MTAKAKAKAVALRANPLPATPSRQPQARWGPRVLVGGSFDCGFSLTRKTFAQDDNPRANAGSFVPFGLLRSLRVLRMTGCGRAKGQAWAMGICGFQAPVRTRASMAVGSMGRAK